MLEKLIEDDIAAAKTPVLLVAFAGKLFTYQSWLRMNHFGHVESLNLQNF